MQLRSQRTAKKVTARLGHGRFVRLADIAAGRALERAKNAFGREGFGVVAEIDLREILERKLDKDIGPYWVLEICNPMLAGRSLAVDRAAGLLMPCRVAVWQEGKDAVVAALRPEAAAALTDVEGVASIASEAERHIERALILLAGEDLQLDIATVRSGCDTTVE